MVMAWERVAQQNSDAFEMKCREHMQEVGVKEDSDLLTCAEAPCRVGCLFIKKGV
jgi:hypothetical protein